MGVVLVVAPLHSVVALLTFAVSLLFSRMVSLSSILAALAFLIFHLQKAGLAAWSMNRLPLTIFSLIVPATILWRHRSNVVRILNGTERRIGSSKRSPEENSKP
jgi:glycerol-3-phosphate acyltransferase PlsY